MKRIEINLSEETDKAIQANAKQANRSRKNYIETLCEIDAKKSTQKLVDGLNEIDCLKTVINKRIAEIGKLRKVKDKKRSAKKSA